MNIAILGGDRRSTYLAQALSDAGHRVRCHQVPHREDYTLADALGRADAVILPIPTKALPIAPDTLLPLLPPHARIFGGGISPAIRSLFPHHSLTDVLAVEALAVHNAALTARAAVMLLQASLPRSLTGEPVLVLGAGRVGTLTGLELMKLGAQVTVAARSPAQRAKCSALGMQTAPLDTLPRCGIVVNTIPAQVLDAAQPPAESLLMELASAPGGFDAAAAEALGHRVLSAPGLPGMYLPESAGKALAETILALLG